MYTNMYTYTDKEFQSLTFHDLVSCANQIELVVGFSPDVYCTFKISKRKALEQFKPFWGFTNAQLLQKAIKGEAPHLMQGPNNTITIEAN